MSRRTWGRVAGGLPLVLMALVAAAPRVGLAKTVVCPGPTILDGIDVSYWQLDVDWTKVKAAGKKYAIMRAAHALKADTKFAYNWKTCHAVGLHCGVYQYFEPDIDPIAQADLMISMMGKLAPGDLPPVIDVESKGSATPTQFAAAIGKWMDRVEKATGRKPMIYTGAYFWEDYVKASTWVDHPLWHAQYCTSCCPNIPNPWKKWAFWQHSSTGKVSGINGNVDLNRFNGDAAALAALASVKTCTPGCKGNLIVDANCGEGDCGAYGAYCSMVSTPAPKCVSAFCAASATSKPKAGDVCLPDGKRYTCDAVGDIKPKACPADTSCTMVGGAAVCAPTSCKPTCSGNSLIATDCSAKDCATLAGFDAGTCVDDALGPRCVSKHCPATGVAATCLPDPKHLLMGLCQDGKVTSSSCLGEGQVCAMTPAGPASPPVAACASVACASDPTKPLVASSSCVDAATLQVCDDYGQLTLEACPGGSPCQLVAGAAQCGGAVVEPDAGGGADGAGGSDAGEVPDTTASADAEGDIAQHDAASAADVIIAPGADGGPAQDSAAQDSAAQDSAAATADGNAAPDDARSEGGGDGVQGGGDVGSGAVGGLASSASTSGCSVGARAAPGDPAPWWTLVGLLTFALIGRRRRDAA